MANIEQTTVDAIFMHEHLFVDYGKETKGDLVPDVVPDKAKYLALEQAEVLHCIGVFDGIDMVGFAVFYISPMLHYSEVAATMESVYIEKKHRKYGTGKKLFSKVEELALSLGATNLFVSAPIGSSLAAVSKSLGLKPTSTIFTRKL